MESKVHIQSGSRDNANATRAGVSEEISLEQLIGEHPDIRRWINTTVKGLLPPTVDIAKDDAEVEVCVVKLFNKLQSHLQEVSGSVEETIAQALVRLPRTGLEVGRMATEALQLQHQLQGIHETMQGAVEVAAKPYVAQLNALKKTQEKLNRCAETLQKASRVDCNMKQLDDFMRQLRTTPTEVDMSAVAEVISHVRRDLAELQQLDITFGEKQLETVEQYEQAVQRTVEAECLELLLQRQNVDRAGHLLNVLDMIGRVDVVLKHYALESVVKEKKMVQEVFAGGGTGNISCSRAAEALKQQLIPSVGNVLADQLNYLLRMVSFEEQERVGETLSCTSLLSSRLAESRTLKALQLMVLEIKGAISSALEPILEQAEENNELIACYDAIQELKLAKRVGTDRDKCDDKKNDVGDEEKSVLLGKLSNQITAYALSEMIEVFSRENILKAFARRESCNLRAILNDPQSFLKRERFREAMEAVTNGVQNIVCFFPEKTLPLCAEYWQDAFLESISHLQTTPQTSQEILLEQLSSTSTMLQQLIPLAQKSISDHLTSPELQRLHPTLAESIKSQLWVPLERAIENCAKECQQALKRTIIGPVIAKAAGYDLQPLWGTKEKEGDGRAGVEPPPPPVRHAAAQVAPSKFVRALGEAIVEIPLTLESLRNDRDFGARNDDIEELLEEIGNFWLDDIVRTAVMDFMENKVGNITIYFPADMPEAAKKEAAAVEQLVTDLNYLKSILLVVSGDPFELLERALANLNAVALPWGKPLVIRQLIFQS